MADQHSKTAEYNFPFLYNVWALLFSTLTIYLPKLMILTSLLFLLGKLFFSVLDIDIKASLSATICGRNDRYYGRAKRCRTSKGNQMLTCRFLLFWLKTHIPNFLILLMSSIARGIPNFENFCEFYPHHFNFWPLLPPTSLWSTSYRIWLGVGSDWSGWEGVVVKKESGGGKIRQKFARFSLWNEVCGPEFL